MRILPRVAAVIALPCALIVFAACSSGSDAEVASLSSGPPSSAGAKANADPEEQRMQFVQCMRKHGVDMPDPSEGAAISMDDDLDAASLDAAGKACAHLLPQDSGSSEQDAAAQDQMLTYAQCMRKNGVDMPDPGAEGGLVINVPEGADGEQRLEEATAACADILADLTGSTEGGGK